MLVNEIDNKLLKGDVKSASDTLAKLEEYYKNNSKYLDKSELLRLKELVEINRYNNIISKSERHIRNK
jgi:hypothetical protein